MKKFLKIGCLGLFVIFVIGIFVFLFIKSRPKVITYEIITVGKGNIENTSVATGKVSPRDEILIKPQISGIVSFSNDSAFVYTVKDENAKPQVFDKKFVKVGLSNGINIEIKEGLAVGDKIRGNEVSDKPKVMNEPKQ